MIHLKRATAVRYRLRHSTPVIYLVIILYQVMCCVLYRVSFFFSARFASYSCLLTVLACWRVGVLPSVIVRGVRRGIEKHEREHNQWSAFQQRVIWINRAWLPILLMVR